MTENQNLREALQYVRQILTKPILIDSHTISCVVAKCDEALALPTAAPEMPLSMNQFGRLVELTREHLTDNTFVYKATSTTGDTCHFGVESAAKAWSKGGTVEPIKVREFKLHTSGPTSDHLPDAGKMIETAAPVGERELFEREAVRSGYSVDKYAGTSIYADISTARAYEWWQSGRAALRAGDAADAQRWRYAMDWGTKDFAVCMRVGATGVCWEPIKTDGPIDEAMRKGQL